MIRTAALLIAITSLVVSLPAVPGLGAPMAAVKLGSIIPLTGRYASLGSQIKAGYDLALEDINGRGGVKIGAERVQLALTELDDESDPNKVVSRLEALASQGVVAYLGTAGSDLHAAAAAVAEKNKIPYCGVGFALHGVHEHGFRYLFSPFPKSPDLASETYRFLNASIPADSRPRRVAIFQERTDGGREFGAIWTARSSENGYQIVTHAEYTPLTKDFSDIVLRAKSAGADAVFSYPNPPDGIALIRQMKELDFNPKAIVMVRAPDGVGWSQALGKDGDNVLFMPGWHHDVKFPGVQELNAKHQQRFGRQADVLVGPAYACMQIVAAALERAGKADPAAIRDAMAATDMTTVVGRVRFRPDGTGLVRTVIVQWQGGKQELVWPKDLGAKALVFPTPPWRGR